MQGSPGSRRLRLSPILVTRGAGITLPGVWGCPPFSPFLSYSPSPLPGESGLGVRGSHPSRGYRHRARKLHSIHGNQAYGGDEMKGDNQDNQPRLGDPPADDSSGEFVSMQGSTENVDDAGAQSGVTGAGTGIDLTPSDTSAGTTGIGTGGYGAGYGGGLAGAGGAGS